MLKTEEKIKQAIKVRFPDLATPVRIVRKRRMSVDIGPSDFKNMLDFCCNEQQFVMLCAITGLDEGEMFSAIYHLAREDGIVLNLKLSVLREKPIISTITDRFSVATLYERELVDMFGFIVEGLPAGNRYPLPDGWAEGVYPLRKDFVYGESTEIPTPQ